MGKCDQLAIKYANYDTMQTSFLTEFAAMTFRVICPNCQKNAIVKDSREVSKGLHGTFVKDLYCHCTNIDCCASFVATVAFSRYLNPPRQTAAQLAAGLLAALPASERQAALDLVCTS